MAMICRYNNAPTLSVVYTTLAVLLLAILAGGGVDPIVLRSLQAGTVPVLTLSKLPQIFMNWSNRSTGSLSAVTVFLTFAGSLARVLTTAQEVDDPVLLIGFAIASAVNGILVVQMLLYWRRRPAQ